MKEKLFEDKLKQKLINFEQEPSPEVYNRIHEQLHPQKKGIFFIWTLPTFVKYGMAASLAFALGMLSMNYFNQSTNLNTVANQTSQNNNNQSVIDENSEQNVNENANNTSATLSATSLKNSTFSSFKNALLGSVNQNQSKQTYVTQNNTLVFSEANNNAISFLSDPLESPSLTVYSLYNFQNLPSNEIELVKVTEGYKDVRFEPNLKSRIGYTGFWFGPEISFQSKFIGKTHIMGSGLGLDYGYDFNPVFGLQSGLKFNLLIKDFKMEDAEGKVSHQLVDFSAFTLPLSLRFKKSYFAKNIERPVSWNTYLGMDYTRLSKLKMNQFGAHVGMEYDIFLKPEMMITLGAKVGVSNIPTYEANPQIWGNGYQKLHTNLGVYTALRFVVPKHKN